MHEVGSDRAGELIRLYRRQAGLTQQQLAAAAGVSIGVVRDIEQGRTTGLRAGSVRRLAAALRLSRRQAAQLGWVAQTTPAPASEALSPGCASGLRIGVLGPLAAWRFGVPVSLGPPMQRALLGLLALSPAAGLPRAAIIDALWCDDPPVTAVSMVQAYIGRLRRLLDPAGPVPAAGGYQLRAAGCVLDLVGFAALVRRGREAQAAANYSAACAAYSDGLAMWRGDPLADVDVLRDHPAIAQLSQQRAEAVIGLADASSAIGWPDRALPQLRELAYREPFNERAHARLMLALAGGGQQAAALDVYERMRRRLDDQLGLRPGAELADAYTRVLCQRTRASPRFALAASDPAHRDT
jgi:DNA-binding SARP family transcriptional activator